MPNICHLELIPYGHTRDLQLYHDQCYGFSDFIPDVEILELNKYFLKLGGLSLSLAFDVYDYLPKFQHVQQIDMRNESWSQLYLLERNDKDDNDGENYKYNNNEEKPHTLRFRNFNYNKKQSQEFYEGMFQSYVTIPFIHTIIFQSVLLDCTNIYYVPEPKENNNDNNNNISEEISKIITFPNVKSLLWIHNYNCFGDNSAILLSFFIKGCLGLINKNLQRLAIIAPPRMSYK